MYALLAIDLDGTLLDGRKRISQQNIDGIARYCQRGGVVAIVTGRAPYSAAKKVLEIEQRARVKIDYYVCFNGAYVFDNINKKVVTTNLMPPAKLAYLHELARSRGYTLWMYTQKSVADNQMIATRSLITRGFIISRKMRILLTNKLPDDSFYKVNFIAYTPLGITYLLKFMRKTMDSDFEFFRTSKWIIEVTDKGITKGAGIATISKLTKIPLSQMAAIGDSMNDLAMLSEVGLPMAPGNAVKAIKQVAKIVVKPNDESAVASAIDHILDVAQQ